MRQCAAVRCDALGVCRWGPDRGDGRGDVRVL